MSPVDWWTLGKMLLWAFSVSLAVWLLMVGAGALMHRANLIATFRWDTSNPFRRYCKRCGQQHENFLYTLTGQSRWEPVGSVKDKDCACQR